MRNKCGQSSENEENLEKSDKLEGFGDEEEVGDEVGERRNWRGRNKRKKQQDFFSLLIFSFQIKQKKERERKKKKKKRKIRERRKKKRKKKRRKVCKRKKKNGMICLFGGGQSSQRVVWKRWKAQGHNSQTKKVKKFRFLFQIKNKIKIFFISFQKRKEKILVF